MLEHEDTTRKLEKYFLVFLVSVALFYGGLRAYPLLAGPQIALYSPSDGDIVASSSFEVSGKVSRVREITIQGRPVPIDTEGHFKELLVASPPYTILVVTATDFYGASITKTVSVIPQ
jgi:Glucodextranase, domain B